MLSKLLTEATERGLIGTDGPHHYLDTNMRNIFVRVGRLAEFLALAKQHQCTECFCLRLSKFELDMWVRGTPALPSDKNHLWWNRGWAYQDHHIGIVQAVELHPEL